MRFEITPVLADEPKGSELLRPSELPLVMHADDGSSRVCGTVHPDGLWRRATISWTDDAADEAAVGLASIMDALAKATGALPHVAIPIHDGYMVVYGHHAVPWSRILKTHDSYVVRHFDPHGSQTFANLADAVAHARHPDAA